MAASAPTASGTDIGVGGEDEAGRHPSTDRANTGWGHQDQAEVYKALLQQKTGRTWYCVFAQEFGQWTSNGKGNLIMSTYPINIEERYELMRNADRSIALAEITVNGRQITIINTHLDPYDQALRLAQATEVTTWTSAQPENRIITGDMNAWPDQTSIAQFNRYYNDSWTVAVQQGAATAFAGETGRIGHLASKSASNLA
jgi:endonuclease/exonuclease/phosphatase family metal-dependent hydrolase